MPISTFQFTTVSQVPLSEPILPVTGPPLWPLNSSDGVHLHGQRGQTNGSAPEYKDPPVPRRLINLSPYQRTLPPGHPIPPRSLPGVPLGGEPTKVKVRTKNSFLSLWVTGTISYKDWSNRPRTIGSRFSKRWNPFCLNQPAESGNLCPR